MRKEYHTDYSKYYHCEALPKDLAHEHICQLKKKLRNNSDRNDEKEIQSETVCIRRKRIKKKTN